MNIWQAAYHLALDFFYPDHCLICNELLLGVQECVCDKCVIKFEPTNLGNWINSVTHAAGIDRVYSGWYFNPDFQKIIHSLKYNERTKLGLYLGRSLGHLLRIESVGPLDLLLPVPLHALKKRERGYNQAGWIAKGLSFEWGIDINSKLIKRKKYTVSQTKLNTEERMKNMADAFVVDQRVEGLSVGLVDDVLTTGSTISACAVSLKTNGVKDVVAITCGTPKFGTD